jgi:hypothetical protein
MTLSFSTHCQLEWGTPTEGWPKSPEGLITGRQEVSRSVEGVCNKANGRTNCAYHDTVVFLSCPANARG